MKRVVKSKQSSNVHFLSKYLHCDTFWTRGSAYIVLISTGSNYAHREQGRCNYLYQLKRILRWFRTRHRDIWLYLLTPVSVNNVRGLNLLTPVTVSTTWVKSPDPSFNRSWQHRKNCTRVHVTHSRRVHYSGESDKKYSRAITSV